MKALVLFCTVFLISCGSSKRHNSPRLIEISNWNYVEIKNDKGKVRVYEIVYPEKNDYGLKLKPKKGKNVYRGIEKQDYKKVKSIVENAIKTKQALLQFEKLKYHILIFDGGHYRFYTTDTLTQEELQEIYSIIKLNP